MKTSPAVLDLMWRAPYAHRISACGRWDGSFRNEISTGTLRPGRLDLDDARRVWGGEYVMGSGRDVEMCVACIFFTCPHRHFSRDNS